MIIMHSNIIEGEKKNKKKNTIDIVISNNIIISIIKSLHLIFSCPVAIVLFLYDFILLLLGFPCPVCGSPSEDLSWQLMRDSWILRRFLGHYARKTPANNSEKALTAE
jgi:hypothetical protein